jgi:DNA-binding transcriptional LysR family regulator
VGIFSSGSGVQFFDRSRGKTELTAQGKVQKPIPPVEETVHVAATPTVLSYLFPPFIGVSSLGFGVTILEDFAITVEDRKKLCVIDLGAFFEKRKYLLLMREKRYLNPASCAFLDLIRKGLPSV